MPWSGEEINYLIAGRRRTNQVNKYINFIRFFNNEFFNK